MKSKLLKPTQRRGLSSIVGALLFVVLMVAAFAVFGTALDSQTNIVDTSKVVADQGLKKQKEHFVVNSILQLPGEPLEINVTNKGQNPTEIFTVVITNSSDVADGYPTQTIDIPSDTSFLPPYSDSPTDIVKTLNFTMANSTTPELYEIKVISSLGNIQKSFVVCQNAICGLGGGGSATGLFSQFLMDGPTGVNTKNSTGLMFVTNIGEVPLTDVAPLLACSKGNMFTISPDTFGTSDFNPCKLKPLSIDTLEVGQTAVFQWDGVITGEIGDTFLFCNQASGTDPDFNTVTSLLECDDVIVIDPNDCGGCGPGGEKTDPIVLIDDLLVRPSIFMTIPNPWGLAGDNSNPEKGIWGVTIANPTNSTMSVSKVTVGALVPGAQSNDLVWWLDGGPSDPTGCRLTAINPQTPNDFSCPSENILMWKNQTDPVVLPPYTVKSFIAKGQPGGLAGTGRGVEAVMLQASVTSTSGSFGKAGYLTTMLKPQAAIGSVFGTIDPNPATINDSDVRLDYSGIQYNSTKQFHIALGEVDLDSQTWINSTAKLIVNVPRGWTNVVDVPANTTKFTVTQIKQHGDTSTQIFAETTEPLGDLGTPEFAVLSFTARAPDPDVDALYPMYVLADGITWNAAAKPFSLGAQSEIIVEVDAYVPP